MRRRLSWAALLGLCTALPAHAVVTMEEVLDSSGRHYPKVIEAQEKLAEQAGKIQKAQGAFDWELTHKSGSRLRGFYDGTYAESQITRRLSESATRVYGGYRVSDGTFPIYEQENVTLDAGEVHAGLLVSLWRDRLIDEERFAFTDAQLEYKQRETELLLTRLAVQYDAMSAYMQWVSAGLGLQVARDQLALSEQRQTAFEQRVRQGDLARIYLTENQQTILKRRSEVTEAERKLQERAIKLSLFLRDDEGDPLLPGEMDLPPQFPTPAPMAMQALDREIERARSLRPELIGIQLEEQRKRNSLLLGENKMMPKVDVFLEGAQDMGSGSVTMRPAEAKVGLSVSIPLQRNTGEGMVAQTKAELRQIEQRKRLLNDQIATEIQNVANNYQASQTYAELAAREVETALTMQQAERTRFEQGAADFFVLNMREDRVAEARLKQISATTRLWESIAGYYLATLQSKELGLKN